MRAFPEAMSQKGKHKPTATNKEQTAGTPASAASNSFPWLEVGIIALVQAVLLGLAAKNNLEQLNNDAIAYLKLGEYYASGQMGLAVSGYWGPMLSWLIAIGIKLGFAPMVAGRIAMVFSGLIFQAGCVTLFRVSNLSRLSVITASIISGLATIFWSAEYLSPDLLLTGLLLAVWAILFSNRWYLQTKWAIIAGVLWGLAYFTKAIAFPLALGTTVLIAGFRWFIQAERKQLIRATGITLISFVVVALPWLLTLTNKYGHFTFSTSGSINHSIVGPKDVDRYHPVFRTLHQPETGRVTQWEEPSRMEYKPWSPFASSAYFQHQIGLVKKNFDTIIGHLANFDLLFLGMIGMLGSFYVKPPWREKLQADRWRWSLIPLLGLCALYLPVWVAPFDERYFYTAFAIQLVCALSLVDLLRVKFTEQAWAFWVGLGLVAVSFGLFPAFKANIATEKMRHDASILARNIAVNLKKDGVSGPIAGSGTVIGFRTGLFTAYFLNTPWLGGNEKASSSPVRGCECPLCQGSTLRETETTADDFDKSGANILILSQESAAANDLRQKPNWRQIDTPTIPGTDSASPVAIFARRKP